MRGGGAGDSAYRLPRSRPCGGGDTAMTCDWPAPRLSALSQANGVDDYTTGNREFAVCLKVCRVLFFGHTAKNQYAVRRK